jgi:hypothetical protein
LTPFLFLFSLGPNITFPLLCALRHFPAEKKKKKKNNETAAKENPAQQASSGGDTGPQQALDALTLQHTELQLAHAELQAQYHQLQGKLEDLQRTSSSQAEADSPKQQQQQQKQQDLQHPAGEPAAHSIAPSSVRSAEHSVAASAVDGDHEEEEGGSRLASEARQEVPDDSIVSILRAEKARLLQELQTTRAALQASQKRTSSEQEGLWVALESVKKDAQEYQQALLRNANDIKRLELLNEDLQREMEELSLSRAELRLKVQLADKKSERDFVAFENALKNGERDVDEWQRKYSDAMAQVSRLQRELDRLAEGGGKLSELQLLKAQLIAAEKENTALRQDKIRLLEEAAVKAAGTMREPTIAIQMTASLKETVALLHHEKTTMTTELFEVQERLQQREEELAKAEAHAREEQTRWSSKVRQLEDVIGRHEERAAAEKLTLVTPLPEALRAQVSEGNQTNGEETSDEGRNIASRSESVEMSSDDETRKDTEIKTKKDASRARHDDRKVVGQRSESRSTERPETWERSTQAHDVQRAELERELQYLREHIQALQEDAAKADDRVRDVRDGVHESMFSQLQSFEEHIERLEKEAKIRQFKLVKETKRSAELDKQLESARQTIESLHRRDTQEGAAVTTAEQKALMWKLERDELHAKVKVLKEEVERYRDLASKAAATTPTTLMGSSPQQPTVQPLSSSPQPQKVAYPAAVTTTMIPSSASSVSSSSHHTPKTPRGSGPNNNNNNNNSHQAAVHRLDDLMLTLHQQSVSLDAEEHAVRKDTEQRKTARDERLAFLTMSLERWEARKHAQGALLMIQNLSKEKTMLEEEAQRDDQKQREYLAMVGEKRQRVLEATRKILAKRAQLDS